MAWNPLRSGISYDEKKIRRALLSGDMILADTLREKQGRTRWRWYGRAPKDRYDADHLLREAQRLLRHKHPGDPMAVPLEHVRWDLSLGAVDANTRDILLRVARAVVLRGAPDRGVVKILRTIARPLERDLSAYATQDVRRDPFNYRIKPRLRVFGEYVPLRPSTSRLAGYRRQSLRELSAVLRADGDR